MASRTDLAAIPWTSLRAFEAASRLGSFKAAASELSVTPTAISHQVKRLETHLGLALFDRLHRSLRLTAAGEVLGAEAQGAFLRLERSIRDLKLQGRATGAHSLTVSAVPSFATKWLAPRLHSFQAAHPRIALRLVADEGLIDFRRDRTIDIALRYGPGPYSPDVHAEQLWPKVEVVAVCAPALAKKLRAPADLLRQTLIRTARPAALERSRRDQPILEWLTWFTAAGVRIDDATVKTLEGPVFSASHLAIEAAAAGQGIALAPAILVDRDVSSGRLMRLFATSAPDTNAFWVLCRADRVRESRIRAFMKWIREERYST
ncbi:LysR substrate-binding domain-containing protein [Methylocapsa sp. S129]|uniref:LysR substrate-binding domain-containing protein n=1 Tax=Methylocapsa sp. S129 TaxID=1641869 RepID=UPI00131B1533|nr:LysR substrate-binding domain-containing protein [Methylocapsa sp. S129]